MLDHMRESQDALATANKHLEKAVFWGMVFVVVLLAFGMLKGIFG